MQDDRRHGHFPVGWPWKLVTVQVAVSALKVPKCEIFDPFFFASINPIWVGDLRTGEKFFFFRRLRHTYIRNFVFFAQAEPALKNCLRRLSLH